MSKLAEIIKFIRNGVSHLKMYDKMSVMLESHEHLLFCTYINIYHICNNM